MRASPSTREPHLLSIGNLASIPVPLPSSRFRSPVTDVISPSSSPCLSSSSCHSFYHSDLPINFLFVKLSHHLLGLPSPPSGYTLASSLVASSCRTWERYCRKSSASCLSLGGSYICEVTQLAYAPCSATVPTHAQQPVQQRERGRHGERLTWFSGNPGSPGIAKLRSSAMFMTSLVASRTPW